MLNRMLRPQLFSLSSLDLCVSPQSAVARLHVGLLFLFLCPAKEWSAPLFFCWLEGLHGAGRLN